MNDTTKPLDGMTIEVTVVTPTRIYRKSTTPVDIRQDLLNYYLQKHAENIWKDIEYFERASSVYTVPRRSGGVSKIKDGGGMSYDG